MTQLMTKQTTTTTFEKHLEINDIGFIAMSSGIQ